MKPMMKKVLKSSDVGYASFDKFIAETLCHRSNPRVNTCRKIFYVLLIKVQNPSQ